MPPSRPPSVFGLILIAVIGIAVGWLLIPGLLFVFIISGVVTLILKLFHIKTENLDKLDILPVHFEVLLFGYPVFLILAVAMSPMPPLLRCIPFGIFLLVMLLGIFFVYPPVHRWCYIIKIPYAIVLAVPFILLLAYFPS